MNFLTLIEHFHSHITIKSPQRGTLTAIDLGNEKLTRSLRSFVGSYSFMKELRSFHD
uniref:Uncharacterized protein n=1 Tax=Vibrio crassostreae TaxID=246167 RepID=A0A0H4A0R7_9VIBR|nr:hypothetical protein [Vibrio crassostreae]